MNPKIEAVVFDIGEVLIKLHLPEELKTLHVSQTYDLFERGVLSEEAFFAELPGEKERFLPLFNSILRDEVPGVRDLLRELKTNVRIFALTNSNETHIRHANANYRLMNHFEKVFTSFELRCRKPERLIYQKVSDSIRIPPERVLFVDDREENVVGAKEFGWNAEIVKNSPDELIQVLRNFKVLK